jgi:ferritin-like metal-binding protein YciE
MLQVRSRLGRLGRSREDFAPLANEPSAHVACNHGTTLSGIRYPHAVRHRISLNGEAAMAKEPKKLDNLFHDTLKDIYFAEKRILSTLPKMAKAAQSEELKAAFEKHRGETEGQIERLEQVFAIIGEKPRGKTCAAIVGITDEGAEIMEEYKGSPALDAGLLAAAQAVEHYEISRYGTLRAWAEELGLNEAVELLQETLQEEEATDEALTEIAKSVINQQAQAA